MTLERHVHDPAPELVAAALLHDISRHGPTDVDVDAVLTVRFTGRVARIVRALHRELDASGPSAPPALNLNDEGRWTLQVSAADKMVALGSVLRRAANALDPAAYWEARAAFVALCRTSHSFTRRPRRTFRPAWPGNWPGSSCGPNRQPPDWRDLKCSAPHPCGVV